MGKTMISARVDDEINEKLDALAASTQRSKAFLISEALETYVERKAWLTSAMDAALSEARSDGAYVSEEDMSAWFKTWGNGKRAELPILRKRDA